MDTPVNPTMRELARNLGLALSSVSMALKDNPRIAVETRNRVKAAAAAMGYVPDPRLASVMSHLKKKRVDKAVAGLAYITSFSREMRLEQHPIYHNYYRGAKARALELGYRLENYDLKLEGFTGKRLMSILRSRGIEGIIIAPLFDMSERLDLDYAEVSSITFGYSLTGDGINRVGLDQFLSVLKALEEMAKFGYRRIGFVANEFSNERMQFRWQAGLVAFQSKYPKQHPVPYFEGTDRAAFLKWYADFKPDAILCHGLDWPVFLYEEGLVCGRDYGFATFTHESLEMHCALLGNPLMACQFAHAAGMNQNSLHIGSLAVELLAKDLALNLKGLSSKPKSTLVDATWVEGDTLRMQ